jgi:hypothetical protein
VQQVSGVRHVLNVDVTWREMQPSKESVFSELEKRGEMIRDLSMSPVKERILRVPENALLCSLSNEIAEITL